MDLVEIRKKAKQAKTEAEIDGSKDSLEPGESRQLPDVELENASGASPEPQAPETDNTGPAVDGRVEAPPGERVPASPAVGTDLATVKPAAPQDDADLLAQLFLVGEDLQLASEESYLQAIAADDADAEKDGEQWLTFNLAEEEYGLPIRHVSEIIKPREVTDLPRVPEFILGIISLRGVIVPILDLRRRLQFAAGEGTARSRIIVCEHGERIAGLLVDQITQVIQLPERSKEQPPAMLTGVDKELVEGVGRIQGRMIILLDLPTLLEFGSA